MDGIRYDAIPVRYEQAEWLAQFERVWPEGSPAHVSYHGRLLRGPAYSLGQAVRDGVSLGAGV